MKSNKKLVLLHLPTGRFYKSMVHKGYGPNNKSVYQIVCVSDVSQAEIGSKRRMRDILTKIDKYHTTDEQKFQSYSTDFEVKTVQISYTVLP